MSQGVLTHKLPLFIYLENSTFDYGSIWLVNLLMALFKIIVSININDDGNIWKVEVSD